MTKSINRNSPIADGAPELSVVIASFNARQTIEACLESLENQATPHLFEIVVVDSSNDGTAAVVEKRFPSVRLHHFRDRKFCGDARNMGIARSSGPIVAFLDADCTVEKNWVNEVIKAHQTPHLAVGGVVDNGSPESLVGWGYYFCEFSLWMPRSFEQEIKEMAGCCLSLKRPAFDRYGPFLEGTYSSDTAFQRRMERDGEKVLCVPGIRVLHTATYGLGGFLKHVASHRRDFAEVMAEEKEISGLRRLALLLGSPLMPFPLFLCIAGRVLKSRSYRCRFLLSSPFVFLGLIARSWGEFLGYARGRQGMNRGPVNGGGSTTGQPIRGGV